MVIGDELRDGATGAHEIQHVEVVVVPVRLGLLRVDVLPEGSVQQRGLEVVRAEGVAGEQTVAVAVFDQLLHGGAGAFVEGKGRTHDPENVPVLTLVAQQLDETVVVAGVGRLTAAPLAEGKLVAAGGLLRLKAACV